MISIARHIPAWLLAAFFAFGAYNNAFASALTLQSYESWGYPSFFNYVTAALELTTAILLVLPRYRIPGSALGALVMIGAIGTLVMNGAAAHAVTAVVVLAGCALVATVALLSRRAALR